MAGRAVADERIRTAGAHALVHPAAAEWLRAALAQDGSLYGFAGRSGARALGGGRGPVLVLDSPAGTLAVRHYRRGGAVAGLLGDRYLRSGEPRPLRERAVSQALRAAGVDTPEVLAAVVYPAGPWYRADLATSLIPHAADLAALTFSADPWTPEERVAAWAAAGALLRRFLATGAAHADLNLGNILIERASLRAWLLDLDRCDPPGRARPGARSRMLERFARSRRKHEARSGRRLGTAESEAFELEVRG